MGTLFIYLFSPTPFFNPTFLGHPRFFLGSDSAPHPLSSKTISTPLQSCAAGVFTSPVLLPVVAHILESFGALDRLVDFTSTFGRRFYGRELPKDALTVALKREPQEIQAEFGNGSEALVPFWAGRTINWSIVY